MDTRMAMGIPAAGRIACKWSQECHGGCIQVRANHSIKGIATKTKKMIRVKILRSGSLAGLVVITVCFHVADLVDFQSEST